MITQDTDWRLGFHITKEKTLYESAKRIIDDTPLMVMQIYVANPRSYSVSKVSVKDLIKTKKLLQKYNRDMFIHACLLYNLSGLTDGDKSPKYQNTLSSMRSCLAEELDICAGFGGKGVVVHVGSRKDREEGIRVVAETIVSVLTKDTRYTVPLSEKEGVSPKEIRRRRKVILENSAGEGSKLGSTLEELAEILKLVPEKYRSQVGICIDTAHSFGAGIYDWGRIAETRRFYDDFDRLIGLEFLSCFHLNDSRVPFGSKKDRHEYLCTGYIFSNREEGLREFLLHAYVKGIPLIGEPPAKYEDGDIALGGTQEWETICNALECTDYPLETVCEF